MEQINRENVMIIILCFGWKSPGTCLRRSVYIYKEDDRRIWGL